ncbi:Hypothetical predicted protein, partial [Marmota monax]
AGITSQMSRFGFSGSTGVSSNGVKSRNHKSKEGLRGTLWDDVLLGALGPHCARVPEPGGTQGMAISSTAPVTDSPRWTRVAPQGPTGPE